MDVTDQPQWASFTRIARKARIYERETYFREALADAVDIMGGQASSVLKAAALLLVKPDGIASGKVRTVVDFLAAHDFTIVAAEVPTLTRFHWRELWRYQLTSATLDRLAVNDLVMQGQALLLLLLLHDGALDIPASVWLSGLKGPSSISAQQPGCLRRLLGQPNRVFSFIHVADEPADVLRELGIIFEAPGRRRVLSALADGAISPAGRTTLGQALAKSHGPERSLDAHESLERTEAVVHRRAASIARDVEERILSDLGRMRRGERISWRAFSLALTAARVDLDPWDLATLGATFIVYDEPGESKLIEAVDAASWRRAPPVRVLRPVRWGT